MPADFVKKTWLIKVVLNTLAQKHTRRHMNFELYVYSFVEKYNCNFKRNFRNSERSQCVNRQNKLQHIIRFNIKHTHYKTRTHLKSISHRTIQRYLLK